MLVLAVCVCVCVSLNLTISLCLCVKITEHCILLYAIRRPCVCVCVFAHAQHMFTAQNINSFH